MRRYCLAVSEAEAGRLLEGNNFLAGQRTKPATAILAASCAPVRRTLRTLYARTAVIPDVGF